ncbi:hypothetical protein GCM10014713_25970 [Streptomyces purpureus]|uniref:Uncharacterized protein n=1 Tax=Streptomyces purpureus TaxID=1951 RepID=A0A918H2Q6_9ACTN|nr:hypothetical protein GCM10014713_25970 [Streptomyces purpureus]
MRKPEPDGFSVVADAGFADTNTLQMCVSGVVRDGSGARALEGRRRCMMPGLDLAATDRGHTAAQIDMQARHERDAHGFGAAHGCRHAEYVNT